MSSDDVTCKCGNEMEYLVGNRGLEAYWCKCGRAALTSDGNVQKWYEPQENEANQK